VYAEGDAGLVELRYLLHLNRRFVTTVFLDPRDFRLVEYNSNYGNDYGKVFVRGCFVRLVPFNQSLDNYKPILSVTFSPAISQEEAFSPFSAFHRWNFAAKECEYTQDMLSIPQQVVGPTSESLEQVNPQAAPHVLEWTNSLPPPGEYSSEQSNDEASIYGRVVPNPLDSSVNSPLLSSALQNTQAIGGFARNLSGDATGYPFVEEWSNIGKEDASSRHGGGNQGNTPGQSRSELSGRQTIRAEQHRQTHDVRPMGHINRAPLYQSRSSMAPSPPTTNASSQVVQNKDQGLQSLHRHLGPPSSFKWTARSGLDQLSGNSNANSTNLSARRSNLEHLKKGFSGLSVGARRDGSNADVVEQSGPKEAVSLPMQQENAFPEDPFVGVGGSESISIPVRHSVHAATESQRPSNEKESEDLLSSSPEKPQLSMAPLIPTPRIASGEQHSRLYHSTMNQRSSPRAAQQSHRGSEPHSNQSSSAANAQAGSQPVQRNSPQSDLTGIFEQGYTALLPQMSETQDPVTMKVYEHMSTILEPLRLFQGSVSLKAEIGRFILTKINRKHVNMPDSSRYNGNSIEAMEKYLERHTDTRGLFFTKIFTLSGGDADYMVNMSPIGNSSLKMWLPKKKEVFYEFWCMTMGESGRKHYFFLDINADNFSYNLRAQDTKTSRVSVHCTKRLFDFRLMVESAHDIEENCGNFAREVVASLKVQ
jgi:hypothetical protein